MNKRILIALAVGALVVGSVFVAQAIVFRNHNHFLDANMEALSKVELITPYCALNPGTICEMKFLYDDGHIETELFYDQISIEWPSE